MKIHIHGDIKPNFNSAQFKSTLQFIDYLIHKYPEHNDDLVKIKKFANCFFFSEKQGAKAYLKQFPKEWITSIQSLIQDEPDITLVRSLKSIIGENMKYIDEFIFYTVPKTEDEI